jgi:hypothetical protein
VVAALNRGGIDWLRTATTDGLTFAQPTDGLTFAQPYPGV